MNSKLLCLRLTLFYLASLIDNLDIMAVRIDDRAFKILDGQNDMIENPIAPTFK